MKSRLLFLLLVPLWLWPALVLADEARWEQYMRAGMAAYQRGDYEEAVRQTKGALKEAEDFGEQDPRFSTTLNNLARSYQAQGRYADAEPLYKRAVAIWEKVLGPEHPKVLASFTNLALFYESQGKYAEAESMYKRALAVVKKALEQNPLVVTTLGNYVPTADRLYTDGTTDRRFTYTFEPTFVYFEGVGWTVNEIHASARQAAKILSQCGVLIPQINLRVLDGAEIVKYFSDLIAKEVVQLVPFSKPTVYFVKDTLQKNAYGAEAIGRSNSNRRPTLRYTIWIVEDVNDPGISLAHAIVQILMDSRGHMDTPRNLMRPSSSPENVELTKVQCKKIRKVGAQNGLLQSLP